MAPKRKESKDVLPKQETPLASSTPSGPEVIEEETSKKRPPFWSKWSEQDIANEKFDVSKKDKDKASSPSAQASQFDDPYGQIKLPGSLQEKIYTWKRIPAEKSMMLENGKLGDITTPNQHLLHEKIMTNILSSISLIHLLCATSQEPEQTTTASLKMKPSVLNKDNGALKADKPKSGVVNEDTLWKAWDLIWPKDMPKVNNTPAVNPTGKYVVKLHWMGCQRKIIVDDKIPFDSDGRALIPFSQNENELWLPILSKAILKVASLNYSKDGSVLSDFNVKYCLIGWLPEPIALTPKHGEEVWKVMLRYLQQWKLPPPPESKLSDCETVASQIDAQSNIALAKQDAKSAKGRDEKKSVVARPDQKNRSKVGTPHTPAPTKQIQEPEVVVFAETRENIADDKLEALGFTSFHSHEVHVNILRNCSLVATPVPPPVPRWKQFRRRILPIDTSKVVREPQFLRIKSPFVGSLKRESCQQTLLLEPQQQQQQQIEEQERQILDNATSNKKPGSAGNKTSTKEKDSFPITVVSPPPLSPFISSGSPSRTTIDLSTMLNDADKNEDVWIDIEDFCHIFGTLWIYHRPKTYIKNCTETKMVDVNTEEILGCTVLTSPCVLVDSNKPVELLFSLHHLSTWFLPPDAQYACTPGCISPSQLGSLVVEKYSWKEVQPKEGALAKVSSSGSKSLLLTLPPGRRVLRLRVYAQLGYHVTVSSSHAFVFCNEWSLMPNFTKESVEFQEYCGDVMKRLRDVILSFDESTKPTFTMDVEDRSNNIRNQYFNAFHKTLGEILQTELQDGFTPEVRWALLALKFKSGLGVPKYTAPKKRRHASLLRFKTSAVKRDEGKSKSAPQLVVLSKEYRAARRIQACFRGYITNKLCKACFPGSTECESVTSVLKKKVWPHIEQNFEKICLAVFQHLFSHQTYLLHCFPFHMWNKIEYSDYTASYTDQYLLCREVFFVKKEMLFVAKLLCDADCLLHIIDNDTPLKTSFNKILPQMIYPNKCGYTFTVVTTNLAAVAAGKLTLRIICNQPPLPTCLYPDPGVVTSNFANIDLHDYYVPNQYNRIFRHTVGVTEDIVASIKFSTSKEDVHLHFKILDGEKEIYSCKGVGSIHIPAFIFFKDRIPSDAISGSQSRASSGSRNSHRRPPSRPRYNFIPEEEVFEEVRHNYVVEAFVARESWPLSRDQWKFVESLKVKEEVDEGRESPAQKSNSGKKGKAKDARARPRPESQLKNAYEPSKPHWNLLFIVDTGMDVFMDVKKDSLRENEIAAKKAAWETAQAGRAAKAQLSRQKYLETHRVTPEPLPQPPETEDQTTASSTPLPSEDNGELTLQRPPKHDDIILRPLKTSHYIRASGKKVLLDAMEEERMEMFQKKRFDEFRMAQEMMMKMREEDRIARNQEKMNHIKEYERMQTCMDEYRAAWVTTREEYRVKISPPEPDPVDEVQRSPTPKRKSPQKNKKKK